MDYTFLGRSNLKVSRVTLGTMHLGNRVDDDVAFRIMDKALDLGINFFDTANVYGGVQGRTEEVIGEWLAQNPGKRDKIVLASKVYESMSWSNPNYVPNEENGLSLYKVKKQLEDSLRRLQCDHLDLYQVHHFDSHISVEEFWEIFELIFMQDKISYVGSSNFPGWGITKFQAEAKRRGRTGLISEQHMYNLLCRYPELEVLPAAVDAGVGLIPYMPLAGGLLTGKTVASAGFRTRQVASEYAIAFEEDTRLKAFGKLCRELGQSEAVVAAAWLLANPAVNSVIIGIRTLEHLDQVQEIVDLKLTRDVVDKLQTIFPLNEGRGLRNNLPTPEAYAW